MCSIPLFITPCKARYRFKLFKPFRIPHHHVTAEEALPEPSPLAFSPHPWFCPAWHVGVWIAQAVCAGTIYTHANTLSLAASTQAAWPTLGRMKEATHVLQRGLKPLGQGLLGSWFPEHGLQWKEWEWVPGVHEPLALQNPHPGGEASSRGPVARPQGGTVTHVPLCLGRPPPTLSNSSSIISYSTSFLQEVFLILSDWIICFS